MLWLLRRALAMEIPPTRTCWTFRLDWMEMKRLPNSYLLWRLLTLYQGSSLAITQILQFVTKVVLWCYLLNSVCMSVEPCTRQSYLAAKWSDQICILFHVIWLILRCQYSVRLLLNITACCFMGPVFLFFFLSVYMFIIIACVIIPNNDTLYLY